MGKFEFGEHIRREHPDLLLIGGVSLFHGGEAERAAPGCEVFFDSLVDRSSRSDQSKSLQLLCIASPLQLLGEPEVELECSAQRRVLIPAQLEVQQHSTLERYVRSSGTFAYCVDHHAGASEPVCRQEKADPAISMQACTLQCRRRSTRKIKRYPGGNGSETEARKAVEAPIEIDNVTAA
jgi:hypothetical protein